MVFSILIVINLKNLKKVLLFIGSNAAKNPTFQPDGWKKVLLNELPETGNKELKFSQIKDLNKFDLKLKENPFESINLSHPKGRELVDKKAKSFELIFLELEFWSRFDVNLYPNLVLKLSICEDQFEWHIKSIEKQLIYKGFDKDYIQNKTKSNDTCLSDFKFSITNELKDEFKIDEFNILYLGVYYSTVDIDLNSLIDSDEIDKVWYKIKKSYEMIEDPKSKGIIPPIKYECKSEDCKSFLINSKKIKNRMFYPRTNSDWESFYESREYDELFRLQLSDDLTLASDYTIEFFYFITKNIKLDVFTSLNENSIISLYSTYSYRIEEELFKWLPVSISLKDLLPYQVNSVKANFTIFIQTTIQPLYVNSLKSFNQLPTKSNGFELAAITNIQLKSGDYHKQKLTDFLTNWSSNGKKASNEWTCLVDSTELYGGYTDKGGNDNSLSIAFFSPKYLSKSTYILISKWFKSNDQVFEIKIENELKSWLRIDTFDENLNILNSGNFELEFSSNVIFYEVLNDQKHPEYYKSVGYEKEKRKRVDYEYKSDNQQVVRLRLSFDLDNQSDDDKPRKILINDVNMNDPCSIIDICKFSTECISLSSTDYKCICQEGHHGEKCEYPNLCSNGSIGDVDCRELYNSTCVPIADSYRCNCSDGYWLNDFKKCNELPFCYTKKGLMDNQCFYNHDLGYEINLYRTFKCNKIFDLDSHLLKCDEFDICRGFKCSDEERCVANIQPNLAEANTKFCACDLDKGYVKVNGTCVHVSTNSNLVPFFKQYLNCSHTYLIENATSRNVSGSVLEDQKSNDFKVSCACENGYKLEAKNCKPDKRECFKKCGPNQLCAYSDNGDETCVCQIGYYGRNCSTNFCEDKTNSKIITALCGEFGCSSTDGIDKPKFVCNCDHRYYYADNSTGLCKMKDVCKEENVKICEAFEATCMPTLSTSQSLIADCVCPQGYQKDLETGQCKEMCESYNYNELANKRCFSDLELKKPEFLCKPGFKLIDNVCVLSEKENKYEIDFEARINLNLDIYLKSNQMKNFRPDLTNLKCDELLDYEGCVRLVNRSYLELEQRSNKLIIDQSYVYSFSNLISISFQSLLGDDLFSLQVLDYEVLKDSSIQYGKFFSDQNSEFKNETAFNLTTPYFKILKFKIYLETNGFFKNLDENAFLKDCQTQLCPIYPYLHVVRGSFRSKSLFLNKTDYLNDCFPGSTAVFKKDSNSLYRCTCNKGYKELARILMSSDEIYFKAICLDIDECSESVHLCDLNTTYCVNKAGSYECRCNNLLSHNKDDFSCYELSELNNCDLTTTDFQALPDFECQCKNKSLIKMHEYKCWDPCLNAKCEIGECLPYENNRNNLDYVCVYETSDLQNLLDVQTPTTRSSMPTLLLIFLVLWTLLNLTVTSAIILYKFNFFKRR